MKTQQTEIAAIVADQITSAKVLLEAERHEIAILYAGAVNEQSINLVASRMAQIASYALDDLLAVLSSHLQVLENKEDTDTRVVERTDSPLPVTTAGTNEATPATASDNHISNVLRELDSYRSAIREAFDEGYAASGMRSPIEHAWERSEARQAEWGFAHTRMSVGALMTHQREGSEVALKPGWLAKQFEQAQRDHDQLPPWLRNQAAHPSAAVSATTADQGSKDEEKK